MSNAGSMTTPDFELNYRAIVIKTAWSWHKTNMMTMEQNRDTNPNQHSDSHFIFDNGIQNMLRKF
jgi:hypothetical protein